MSIRVGPNTVQRILDATGAFALQVQHPSDLGAAIGALKLARVDLLGLAASSTSRATVSPVISAPGGPLVLIERLEAEYDLLRSIPDVVKQRLEAAGIGQAVIDSPPLGGQLDALDTAPHAVVLRLFPRVPGVLPPDWLDMAAEWVTGDMNPNDRALVRVLTVEFDVSVHQVSSVVHECGLAKAWCDAVNGDPNDRVRTASLTFGRLPHLALAAGGPSVDGSGLLARFTLLQDIARELAADVAYACIDFEHTFEGLALGLSPEGWQRHGGASPNLVASEMIDERVPDAYPYQVLGPGHIARLDGVHLPTERLGDGRVEIAFDDARSWFASAPDRADVQAEAWELLRPCLVTEEEASALAELRAMAGGRIEPPSEVVDPHPLANTPDLDAIVLEGAPHSRRGTRLTLLELASWLDHEHHTDSPARVAPVLATYARWLAAGLDDDARQALKPSASLLLGTASNDPADEHSRRWIATEWLVKVQAPAWLRAAGLSEAAERLATVGHLSDDGELVRAVDVLGTAIGIASRRIDITASIANEGNEISFTGDDPMVWEAWERTTESTGWVAASESATHGAPSELTYATDLRVIECSRDPRTREEIEQSKQSIGDSAWSTALHAIADEAWEQAWRAADMAARELSGFTIRIEMGRVAKTVLERDTGDDDMPELALELADRAARDSLTRAALRGGAAETTTGEDHPWDDARNAARKSDGGEAWAFVMDEARHAVGEDAWAQAMADAREVSLRILGSAPDTVARVVAVSVAREASSAAARSVAVRAAAVARAQGVDVEQSVADALEEVASGLRKEAVALLDRMINPRVVAQ